MAAWTVDEDRLKLAEHHCAVRVAAERFPEICAAEVDFLREVLQIDLRRDSYIPDGCNACEYSIDLGERGSRGTIAGRAPTHEES
jgi:predicted ArsR family transcriptional regulator